VTFYSSVSNSIRQALEGQMATPYFPVSFESAACKRSFVDLESAPVASGGLTVHPFPLNHPQSAIGYRIESSGAVIVYASDLEHGHAALDSVLRDYAQNADVLVYDAQYTPEEYPSHRGWGHSTWQEGVRVASDARVRQLVLFHHDPSHDDQFVFRMTQEARRQFENTEAAREGWEIVL
jgi:phosphoribosyl 1,2-cyclic phosphodiesterase